MDGQNWDSLQIFLRNRDVLIITVGVTMFIQGFSKIGPPNKEEMGYIHYDHYNCTLVELTNGCSWTFLFGVALTNTNIMWKEGEVLLIWALQYDVQWFWMTHTVLSDNIESPIKGNKNSNTAQRQTKLLKITQHRHWRQDLHTQARLRLRTTPRVK